MTTQQNTVISAPAPTTRIVSIGDNIGERTALLLPVGSLVNFERWQNSCYSTIYYSTRGYRVQLTKRGKRPFLKLVDSGSYAGHKYDRVRDGRVLHLGGGVQSVVVPIVVI